LRPDPESFRSTRPERDEHDVGAPAEGGTELRVARTVPEHGLLAAVQGPVPFRRDVAERIAVRRLEPHDTRAEAQQLAARERPRDVPREVDHELARERLHYAHKVDWAGKRVRGQA